MDETCGHSKLATVLALVIGFVLAVTASSVEAQTPGNCELGNATADLDIGNVRARLYNNGGLFWKQAGNVYNVPKSPEGEPMGPSSIFAAGIWIAGLVGGEVRQAAQVYGNWEYWPGPLDDNGNPPPDCSAYDRIYRVSRDDLAAYDLGSEPTDDLANWPYDLGAPVVDGDGNPANYDLDAGDRPGMIGDQTAWWIMNDVGNAHATTGSDPIGLEVQVSAFAFARPGNIGNVTAYRYRLTYHGTQELTNAWFGFWTDVDLGNASDDLVGSDTTRGMGFVYNADNDDEGSYGYGSPPPAMGVDFLQGPLVAAPGTTHVDPDGVVHRDSTRLGMTRFLLYWSNSTPDGNPRSRSIAWYQYLQGIWQDGTPMCYGGSGYAPSTSAPCTGVAHFMWPGDPVTGSYWSEVNTDDNGTANPSSDRRFLTSTGPFDMSPGDTQDIVVGIVWARGSDNLDSITQLRRADEMVQRAFDLDFRFPDGPAAPAIRTVESDGGLKLVWSGEVNGTNLEDYEAASPYALGPDLTYDFEGYEVYQFATSDFNPDTATLLATYDIRNGVGEVREETIDGLIHVVAHGSDSGLHHEFVVEGLLNYTEYYFGVQPYAYNGDTDSGKIVRGEMATIAVVPTGVDDTFSLEDIGIVPNPYKGASDYEVSANRDLVRFTGMPEVATIQVFTISGTLVTTLEKDSPERYFEWDLTNEFGRRIGSGVYLVHIDVPGVGRRVVKFGVVIGGSAVGVQ